MMGAAWRQIVAIALLGVGAGVGAELILIEPLRRATERDAQEAAELRLTVDHLESLAGRAPQLAEALLEARGSAAAIERRSTAVRDPRVVFESLHTLAGGHGLVIERLDPIAPISAPPPEARASCARYSLTVRGPFAGVVGFLGHLSDLGYTRVRSADLRPVFDDARDEVLATMETEHWAFDAWPRSPEGDARREGQP